MCATRAAAAAAALTASAIRSSMRLSFARSSALPAAFRPVGVASPPAYTLARALRLAASSFSSAVRALPSAFTTGSLNTFGGARLCSTCWTRTRHTHGTNRAEWKQPGHEIAAL